MTECDSEELKGEQSIQAKDTQIEPVCLPETILPIPDELREPKGGIPAADKEESSPAVEPLLLRNHPVTVTCTESDTYGDAVAIKEGTVTEYVYFSKVPSISSDVLSYIASNKLESWIEEEWYAGNLNSIILRERTGMTIEQARRLLQALRAVQDNLDRIVKRQAEDLLQCHWCSSPQTAICEDPAMARNGTYAGQKAVYTYTVPACAAKSFVSQEDADAKAMDLAVSMLNCFYVNDSCTATCETRPDRPLDEMEPVPNDTTPIYPGRNLRVGRYVVSSGKIISYSSKDDANEQACALAFSMLECWYPNWPIEVSCEPDEETGKILARNMWVNPKEEGPRTADIHNKTTGQIVNVPAGFFISEISSEEANKEAEEFATSLLECCFINDTLEFRCDLDAIYDTEKCEYAYIEANPKKGKTYLKVEAGTFASCVSKEEANEFARQSAEGQLQCIYCNLEILPTCVPDWVMEGVLKGDLTLPLNSDTISYNGHSIKTSSLPPEATLGARGGDYCADEAQQAQNMASSAAKARGSNTCIYFNDTVLIACSAMDPYNPWEELEGTKWYYRINPKTGEAYYFMSLYTSGCLSPLSAPPPSEYFEVSAGLFSGPNKQEVDAKARQFAEDNIKCLWQNPEVKGWCGAETRMPDLCTSWQVGKDTGFPPTRLHDISNTPGNPVILPEGSITMPGVGNDELSIFENIKQAASALVNSIFCVYGNEPKFGECTETGTKYRSFDPGGPGVGWEQLETTVTMHNGQVPGMFIYANTPTEADDIAENIAKSLAACDKNTVITYHCFVEDPSPSPTPSPTSPGGGGEGPTPSVPVPSNSPTPFPSKEKSYCWYDCTVYKIRTASGDSDYIKQPENNPQGLNINLQDRVADLTYRISVLTNER